MEVGSEKKITSTGNCSSSVVGDKWSERILQQFFALLKAFSQGDRCGCNRYEQPQPELWPCGGLWEQWFQGLCLLLATA